MKKTFSVICIVFAVIMLVLFVNLRNVQKSTKEVINFNSKYEFYNREDLCGIDVTTVINKAIDNNEKNNVEKDENGYYIENKENSIKIYIKMIINDKTYEMERIREIGLSNFTEFFGEVKFKCTEIKYHKSTGRIASMVFESLDY